MARALQLKYDRSDKRQAAREQDKLERQLAVLLKEILDDFEDNGWIEEPLKYHERWMKFSENWNDQHGVICLANPRYIHDYLISHEIGRECKPYRIQEPFII